MRVIVLKREKGRKPLFSCALNLNKVKANADISTGVTEGIKLNTLNGCNSYHGNTAYDHANYLAGRRL